MGFFDDDTYENLDYISQAVKPMVFSGNELLAQMPDRIDLTERKLKSKLSRNSYSRYSIGVFDIVRDRYQTLIEHKPTLNDYAFRDMIMGCYELHCDNPIDVDIHNDIYPKIYVVKTKSTFTEKEIIGYIREKIDYMSCLDGDATRTNEMLDLLDYRPDKHAHNYRTSRSLNTKLRGIRLILRDVLADNKWQIRNADLMVKIVDWVLAYIQDGNLAALTNITKLKIMTHKELPIYSIQEAK